MSEPTPDEPDTRRGRAARRGPDSMTVVRARIATVLQIVTVVFAVVLVLGALLVAAGDVINRDNVIARFVLGFAELVDGPLDRENGIVQFDGENSERWQALVNWGLAALVWYLIGRLLGRLVRGR